MFRRRYRHWMLDGRRVPKGTPDAVLATVESEQWYEWVRVGGKRKRVALGTNKKAAVVKLARILAGEERTPATAKNLTSLAEEYLEHLQRGGVTDGHLASTGQQIRSVLDGCGWKLPREIDADRLDMWLAELRRRSGSSARTSNAYLRSIKSFAQWLADRGHLPRNVLRLVSPINQQTDRRRERRALGEDEFARLLSAAANSKIRFRGLSGVDRYWLYQVAASTGLRAGELASLTPKAFDFQAATITLDAGDSKRRRQDVLPIHRDLLDGLRKWVATKHKAEPVWLGLWHTRSCDMLQVDLAAASIEYIVDGEAYDFHAIRGQFATRLAKSGVHPKVAQELMRHSDINLTMRVYTRLGISDVRGAVDGLDLGDRNKKKEELC